jgi:hypothetical protein
MTNNNMLTAVHVPVHYVVVAAATYNNVAEGRSPSSYLQDKAVETRVELK